MAEKEGSASSKEAREFLEEEIRHHREKGMTQDQAVAAAMEEVRKKGMRVPEET